MSRFLRDAASLLEAAESVVETGSASSDWTVVVAPGGDLSLLAGCDWPLDRLADDRGAAMVYRVRQHDGRVSVEGRAGSRTCLFEAAKPDRAAHLLLADMARYAPGPPTKAPPRAETPRLPPAAWG